MSNVPEHETAAQRASRIVLGNAEKPELPEFEYRFTLTRIGTLRASTALIAMSLALDLESGDQTIDRSQWEMTSVHRLTEHEQR